jgi:glutathione S-transferase
MADLKLLLANKAYSSWSLRGWLVVKQTGLPFHEQVEHLRSPPFIEMMARHSPVGKVPTLVHDGFAIWDSLAIAEYCHELAPAAGLWPSAPKARARARSLATEMHSGFMALRKTCPMQMRRKVSGFGHDEDTLKDIARIDDIWANTPGDFGGDGPFLFGQWCAADAFFAPVASRFWTYGAPLSAPAQRYMDAVLDHIWMREWTNAAMQEPWIEDSYEL